MYRLIEKLHLERYLNTRLILAIDLAVSGLASLCALVSVKLLLHLNISDYTLLWLCCSVVYSFVTFYLLKTYHSVIRHSTLREIAKFVVAVIGKELLLGLTILLYPPHSVTSSASPLRMRCSSSFFVCCCSICC